MNRISQATIRFSPSIRSEQLSNVRMEAFDTNTSVSSTRVTISPEGKKLSQASSVGLNLDTLDRASTVDQIQVALKGVDFRNISPREAASLASALDRTGQFDIKATTNLFVSLNTDAPLNLDKRVDLVKHFEFMLDNAHEGAKTDSDLASAVEIRKQGSHLLNTLIGWTQSPAAS